MRQREAARSIRMLRHGGGFELFLQEVADLPVFRQQPAEFLLAGKPLGAPVLVDGDAEPDWIGLLAHNKLLV